jgi:protein TonB
LKLVLLSACVLCVHLALIASLQVNLRTEPARTVQSTVQTRQILERESMPSGAAQETNHSRQRHLLPIVQSREIRATQPSIPAVDTLPDAITSATFKQGSKLETEPSTQTDTVDHAPTAKVAGLGKKVASGEIRLPSSQADYLNNPPPAYPALSLRLHETGKVVVRVLIASNGQAIQGEITQSSGFDRLNQSALQAVLSWRYLPGKVDGQAQDMWFDVPVTFKLPN